MTRLCILDPVHGHDTELLFNPSEAADEATRIAREAFEKARIEGKDLAYTVIGEKPQALVRDFEEIPETAERVIMTPRPHGG
ncbi:MAG: hypothetical protein ACXWNK_07065 [Vulcanimicrobiaceae bacterium]